MAIQRFFTKSIIIKRLSSTSGNKRHMVSTGTIDAHIQRIDQRDSSGAVMVYGATHKAWVDISVEVREGDEFRDPDGNVYTVVDLIVEGDGIAVNEHQAVILRRYKENAS